MKSIYVVHNKTIEEYMDIYGEAYNKGELWDFSREDMENGSVEPNLDMVYWEIEGRLYETGQDKELKDSIAKISRVIVRIFYQEKLLMWHEIDPQSARGDMSSLIEQEFKERVLSCDNPTIREFIKDDLKIKFSTYYKN